MFGPSRYGSSMFLVIVHALVYQLVVTGYINSLSRGGTPRLLWRHSVVAEMSEQTQIIKESCAYRAKYWVDGEYVDMDPFLIVPHPDNRGGDPLKVLRLQGLTAKLAHDGVDLVEANQNAVAVQQAPSYVVTEGRAKDFQVIFEQSILNETCQVHRLRT